MGKQFRCGGSGRQGSRFGAVAVEAPSWWPRWRGKGKGVSWRWGLIQGAIDIVRGGRLSQIPLRDGVAVCLLVEGRRVISRKCFQTGCPTDQWTPRVSSN